jgi:transcriptional regulator with XRE-family HTH domain
LSTKKHMPSKEAERFAGRLRAMRIPRGYKTARSFAEALGIHENRYTRYERAEVEPDLATLVLICETLNVSPNELLCETIGLAADDLPATAAGPGFAEAGASAFSAPSPHDLTQSPMIRFQAEALALSNELAAIAARAETGGAEPDPATVMRLAGELFQRISTAPFTVLPEIGTRIAVSAASLETQRRIAAHITAITDLLRTRGSPENSTG